MSKKKSLKETPATVEDIAVILIALEIEFKKLNARLDRIEKQIRRTNQLLPVPSKRPEPAIVDNGYDVDMYRTSSGLFGVPL